MDQKNNGGGAQTVMVKTIVGSVYTLSKIYNIIIIDLKSNNIINIEVLINIGDRLERYQFKKKTPVFR